MIDVRPTRDADERRLAIEIYNVVWPRHAATTDEVQAWRDSTLGDAEFVAYEDDRPLGAAAVGIHAPHPDIPYALVTVLPAERRRGAGAALYRAVSYWTRTQDLGRLEVRIEEDDPDSLAYAQRRGFREYARNGRLVLDLAEVEVGSPRLPDGVQIVSWAERPELASGIYEVANEAFPDVPGDDWSPPPLEHFVEHHLADPASPRDGTLVALADGEVVGYAKVRLRAARPGVAGHHMTGVKRAWRGRGIAGALKEAQIAWAKSAGLHLLETDNEVRNEPIRRLNARLGYRPEPGQIFLRGPLAPGL